MEHKYRDCVSCYCGLEWLYFSISLLAFIVSWMAKPQTRGNGMFHFVTGGWEIKWNRTLESEHKCEHSLDCEPRFWSEHSGRSHTKFSSVWNELELRTGSLGKSHKCQCSLRVLSQYNSEWQGSSQFLFLSNTTPRPHCSYSLSGVPQGACWHDCVSYINSGSLWRALPHSQEKDTWVVHFSLILSVLPSHLLKTTLSKQEAFCHFK